MQVRDKVTGTCDVVDGVMEEVYVGGAHGVVQHDASFVLAMVSCSASRTPWLKLARLALALEKGILGVHDVNNGVSDSHEAGSFAVSCKHACTAINDEYNLIHCWLLQQEMQRAT